MRISRIRLAISGALGLSLAIIALGMAVLLDHQDDPALAQSNDLRSQFTPPSGGTNPVDALRTPKPQPRPQPTQLAAPAPVAPAAPVEVAAAAPAAAEPAAAPAATVQAAGSDDGAEQEHATDGEQDGGDD